MYINLSHFIVLILIMHVQNVHAKKITISLEK